MLMVLVWWLWSMCLKLNPVLHEKSLL
jgi:hypothetical protein